MPDILIENLSKSYGKAPAVQDVSLQIKDGSFTCILGPSGCGKTTLLRMIAGLETAKAGKITLADRVLDDPASNIFVPPGQRGVGLVFQSYALWPHMRVSENIAFGLRLARYSPTAQRKRVAEMLDILQITELADRYPAQLSGGQQQRVALARTLALAPKILALDEPLSNLDATLRLAMRAELARLHREFGTTIVFVTHDQWEAMTLASDIIVMAAGRVQQSGTPSAIYDTPANQFIATFIGNPPINIFPAASPAALALTAQTMPDRAQITVGLRPEAMAVCTTPQPGALAAKVTAVIPTGGAWITEMALLTGGAPVLHCSLARPDFLPKQPVFISPHRADLHGFAADGQRMPHFTPSHP